MSKLLHAYSNYLARKPLQGNVVTAIVRLSVRAFVLWILADQKGIPWMSRDCLGSVMDWHRSLKVNLVMTLPGLRE